MITKCLFRYKINFLGGCIMKINFKNVDNVALFHLDGEMNEQTSIILREAITDKLSEGHKSFLLNCEKLNYMNSAGLRELIAAYKTLNNKNAVIKFSNLQEDIRDLFKFTNLNKIFDIHELEEEALNSF